MKALGVQEIGICIPENRISNEARKAEFGFDDAFLRNKIGVMRTARKAGNEKASDLCVRAYEDIVRKTGLRPEEVECVVVVTQNPDSKLPHVSAVLHGRLKLGAACSCFDLSLGCSGFVHGLSIIIAFMEAQGLTTGVLFTADPYSEIVNPTDKNTSLLFGDAGTATLVSGKPVFIPEAFTFGTIGAESAELACGPEGNLQMNGQAIFNFAAVHVPKDLQRLLQKANVPIESVDRFLLHQGSKYIVDTIVMRAKLDPAKAPFDAAHYGNTVSSSIPILLEQELRRPETKLLVLSGFGVGLAYASALLRRAEPLR